MSVSFFSVSLDCADAGKLADFWSQVLDRPVDEGGTESTSPASACAGDGSAPAAGRGCSTGSPKASRSRIGSTSISSPVGGRRRSSGCSAWAPPMSRDVDEGGYQWATLTDPEGNEFDMVAAPQ